MQKWNCPKQWFNLRGECFKNLIILWSLTNKLLFIIMAIWTQFLDILNGSLYATCEKREIRLMEQKFATMSRYHHCPYTCNTERTFVFSNQYLYVSTDYTIQFMFSIDFICWKMRVLSFILWTKSYNSVLLLIIFCNEELLRKIYL